jgi:hypothetical protein
MQSRAVIELAKGMLMAAQRCDEETAFRRLVQAWQRENVNLRDIAQRIVTGATRQPGPPAWCIPRAQPSCSALTSAWVNALAPASFAPPRLPVRQLLELSGLNGILTVLADPA